MFNKFVIRRQDLIIEALLQLRGKNFDQIFGDVPNYGICNFEDLTDGEKQRLMIL